MDRRRRLILALMALFTYNTIGVAPVINPDEKEDTQIECSCDVDLDINTLLANHPKTEKVMDNDPIPFTHPGRSVAPFELFRDMQTQYVLVSKLGQIHTKSEYVVTMKGPGMYNVKNKKVLEGLKMVK